MASSDSRTQIILDQIPSQSYQGIVTMGDFEATADGLSIRLDLRSAAESVRRDRYRIPFDVVSTLNPAPGSLRADSEPEDAITLEPIDWGDLLDPGNEGDLGAAMVMGINALRPFSPDLRPYTSAPGLMIRFAQDILADGGGALRSVLEDPDRQHAVFRGAASILEANLKLRSAPATPAVAWSRSYDRNKAYLTLPALVSAAVYEGIPVSMPSLTPLRDAFPVGASGLVSLPSATGILASPKNGIRESDGLLLLREEMHLPGASQALEALVRDGLSEKMVLELCSTTGQTITMSGDLLPSLPDLGGDWWRGDSEMWPGRSRMLALAKQILSGNQLRNGWPSPLPAWRRLGAVRAAFSSGGEDARLLRTAAFAIDAKMCRKALDRGVAPLSLVTALARRMEGLPPLARGARKPSPGENLAEMATMLMQVAVWSPSATELPPSLWEPAVHLAWATDVLNDRSGRPLVFTGWPRVTNGLRLPERAMMWMARGAPEMDDAMKVAMLEQVESWISGGLIRESDGGYDPSSLPFWINPGVTDELAGKACAGLIRTLPPELASPVVDRAGGARRFALPRTPGSHQCDEVAGALRQMEQMGAPRETAKRTAGRTLGGHRRD